MIRYVTAGESHGKTLAVIIEGIPAGLPLCEDDINRDLLRRQQGYGRGSRMKNIEQDQAEIVSGVRWGETLGSPITMLIRNRDWENNQLLMALGKQWRDMSRIITAPRPGHADLAGILKFDRRDVRDILERASARETAARVAAGAVCRRLLSEFSIKLYSFVVSIGGVAVPVKHMPDLSDYRAIEDSPVRCPHPATARKMMALIDQARKKGDTLGGVFQVAAVNMIPGLGSCMQWDQKLDGRIARAVMSIHAVKGVEIGGGFSLAFLYGSSVHDEIVLSSNGTIRRTRNNAGGLEGGMTNGEEVLVRGAMKPIATLAHPLKTIDLRTGKAQKAPVVRSDTCAVPAAGVIAEAAVCIEIARAVKEKFGGDSLKELKRNVSSYVKHRYRIGRK